jgi:hypothetical protein
VNVDTSLNSYNSFTNINSNGVEAKKEYGNSAPVNIPEVTQMGASNGGKSANEAAKDYMQTVGVGFDISS